MDDGGEEGDAFKSSTAPNTRRRIVTKTSLEEVNSDERTVAATTQESLDGIREKATRITSIGELEASSGAGRWSNSGRDENDRHKRVNDIVRVFVGQITKEGDIVVSKSKLQRDLSLKRAIQNWNMKHVVIPRSRVSVEIVHQL